MYLFNEMIAILLLWSDTQSMLFLWTKPAHKNDPDYDSVL